MRLSNRCTTSEWRSVTKVQRPISFAAWLIHLLALVPCGSWWKSTSRTGVRRSVMAHVTEWCPELWTKFHTEAVWQPDQVHPWFWQTIRFIVRSQPCCWMSKGHHCSLWHAHNYLLRVLLLCNMCSARSVDRRVRFWTNSWRKNTMLCADGYMSLVYQQTGYMSYRHLELM